MIRNRLPNVGADMKLAFIVCLCLVGCEMPLANPSISNHEPPSFTPAVDISMNKSAANVQTDLPQKTQALKPFEHENDIEYQNGLASLMFAAPLLGLQNITLDYRWGYDVGIEEAADYGFLIDGMIRELACIDGNYELIRQLHQNLYQKVSFNDEVISLNDAINKSCEKYKDSRFEKSGPQGAVFSKWRLQAAQSFASHTEDTNSIDSLLTIFTVGYNMGFAHQWESVDREIRVEEIFLEACDKHPYAPQSVSVNITNQISNFCAEKARNEREDSGKKMRCLLAADKEMNGEMSGTAFKIGCKQN